MTSRVQALRESDTDWLGEPRDHWVYRAYDNGGRLLYVGCTGNLRQRAASHSTRSNWHIWLDRCRVTGPYGRTFAYALEGDIIRNEVPWFNATGTGGFTPRDDRDRFDAYMVERTGGLWARKSVSA